MAATYKTIRCCPEPSVYKDRGSKFIGYAFPVESEAEVKQRLEEIKKQHHKARHWCYAWRLGHDQITERANDDGEPAHSAGMPILQQIRKRDLTDTLVIVVRYFGGVKLGVGGLIQAYKTAAGDVLDRAEVVSKTPVERLKVHIPYAHLNALLAVLKETKWQILPENTSDRATVLIEVPSPEKQHLAEQIRRITEAEIVEE